MFEKELAEIARLRVVIAENNRKIRKMLIALVIMTILLIAVWASAESVGPAERDDCERYYQRAKEYLNYKKFGIQGGITSQAARPFILMHQSCLMREEEINRYMRKRREERKR